MSRLNGADRPYDIVLFGATGFVGTLTAQYLAAHAPEGLRWAIAGRSERKLEQLRERLPGGEHVGVERADVADPASLRALAEHARVVATTVGPYVTYGEELVAACADAGTDYLDLCGEPEFVDLMYVRHDARARETGARLVHACGFDSIPHDLGAYFTVQQLPEGVPLTRRRVRDRGRHLLGRYVRLGAQPVRARAADAGRRAGPRAARAAPGGPAGRRSHGAAAVREGDRRLGAAAADHRRRRSCGRSAKALERYGPDFRYRHYAAVRHLPVAVGGIAAVGGIFAAAQLPPARRWLSDRLKPGEGPSAEKRAKSWFKVRFVGEGGGRRVFTEVAGGDPGYDETAKMFAESALSLAFDDLPPTAGQVTTAVAMGDALTERLRRGRHHLPGRREPVNPPYTDHPATV